MPIEQPEEQTRKAKSTLSVVILITLNAMCILAILLVPINGGGWRRSFSSYAQSGCGTIASALRMEIAENDGVFAKCLDGPATALTGISKEDLDGKYFDAENYAISGTSTNDSYYLITCTANALSGRDKWEGCSDGIQVSLDALGNDTYKYTAPSNPKPHPKEWRDVWHDYKHTYGAAGLFVPLLIIINAMAIIKYAHTRKRRKKLNRAESTETKL